MLILQLVRVAVVCAKARSFRAFSEPGAGMFSTKEKKKREAPNIHKDDIKGGGGGVFF